MIRLKLSTVATLLIISILPVTASSMEYKAHYLGALPGTYISRALSINNSEQVTGFSVTSNDMRGVFLWSEKNGLTDIRVPGSLDYWGGINDLGEVVGTYSASQEDDGGVAVREADGTIRKLDYADADIYWAGGSAINNLGQVAGSCGLYAAIWRDDKLIWTADKELSQACDINNHGQAIWNKGLAASYRWDVNNGSTQLALLDGTQTCCANSINDAGQIVGSSGDHAVLWQNDGTIVDLGYGEALGINWNGWIVGRIGSKSIMWSPNGDVNDLSSFVGGDRSCAYSINDHGWIVGSVNVNGCEQAVVWEPVPEPSALVALACGLVGVLAQTKKRRS